MAVRTLFGRLTEAGAKAGGSPGWTSSRPATGFYKISFTEAFTSPPAVVFNPDTNIERIPVRVQNVTKESAELVVTNTLFVAANSAVHFLIEGE